MFFSLEGGKNELFSLKVTFLNMEFEKEILESKLLFSKKTIAKLEKILFEIVKSLREALTYSKLKKLFGVSRIK